MKAVIQAGGKGTRLQPYTLVLPKPLLPLGTQPTIEILLQWLRRSNVNEVYITTGTLGSLIQAVCGDGDKWGLKIHYTVETQPLSTVAPLHLIGRDKFDEPFFMLNGDIITDLNLFDFMANHKLQNNIVSVACSRKKIKNEFGVLEIEGTQIIGFSEKPELFFDVSMGIYCFNPDIFDYIPPKVAFGFDDLMYSLLSQNIPVTAFIHTGMWLDIGRPDDYLVAQQIFAENSTKIVGA